MKHLIAIYVMLLGVTAVNANNFTLLADGEINEGPLTKNGVFIIGGFILVFSIVVFVVLRIPTEEEQEQVNKIKEVIASGNPEAAWQLIQSLNDPRISEGLLEDCPVDEEGWDSAPEYLEENGDFFIKLLGKLPEGKLQQLTKLHLSPNQISDVSPLKDLTQLTDLNLGDNQIRDLSPLKELTQLTDLYLHNNQISDVSLLKELTQLTNLYLGYNQISDVSPLANLTQLTKLHLSPNQISDVSPLKDLTQLTDLNLSDNQISDVSPLKELTQLTELNLGDNQISDVSPLKELTQLTELELYNNQICESDLQELQEVLPDCDIDY